MVAIEVEKTVKEITGYECEFDGSWFKTKEECEKYEESALGVLAKEIYPYQIYRGVMYNLNDELTDNPMEIYKIPDADTLRKLNQYRVLRDKTVSIISDNYIGKEVIVFYDYEGCYSWFTTIDRICEDLKKSYDKLVKKEEKGE